MKECNLQKRPLERNKEAMREEKRKEPGSRHFDLEQNKRRDW